MKGGTRFRFTHRPNEEYKVTMPNVYVRGLLFGTMTLELGDSCVITCEETGMLCELEFTTKVQKAF